MWLDAFYISIMSEKYKQGNMLSAIVEGCKSNLHALFGKYNTSSLIYVIEAVDEKNT